MPDIPERTEDLDEGRNDALRRLREAAMEAVEPRPGQRLDAMLVFVVWVNEGPNPGLNADGDFLAYPPDKAGRMLNVIHAMVSDWKSKGWDPGA